MFPAVNTFSAQTFMGFPGSPSGEASSPVGSSPHAHTPDFSQLHCRQVPGFTWSSISTHPMGLGPSGMPAPRVSLARTHPLQLALRPEALMNHGLAAASRHRPRGADEEPDEGRGTHIQSLRETEEPRSLQAVHLRTGFIRHRHCGHGQNVTQDISDGQVHRSLDGFFQSRQSQACHSTTLLVLKESRALQDGGSSLSSPTLRTTCP